MSAGSLGKARKIGDSATRRSRVTIDREKGTAREREVRVGMRGNEAMD